MILMEIQENYPKFDKEESKKILLYMSSRGAKFSKKLEKKIKKWKKKEDKK